MDQGESSEGFEWGYCAVVNASEGECNQWHEPATALEAALEKVWRASVALIAALGSTGVLLVILAVCCIVFCLFRRQRLRYLELESEFKRERARHLADTISLDRVDHVSSSREEVEGNESL